MSPQVALVGFVVGIAGLFLLDRERGAKVSPGLWLPVIWLWIFGSREVSIWMQSLRTGTEAISGDVSLEGSPIDRVVYMALLAIAVGVLVMRGPRVWRLLLANAR